MTDRLFQIVYALINGKSATCAELARRFQCSPRTIMRDIEKLSRAGVPVFMSRGRGGGVGILGGYVLGREAFSAEERRAILASMQALEATGFGEEAEALEKLKSLFGKTEADWLEIEFSRWGAHGKVEAHFAQIKAAILRPRVLKLLYASGCKTSAECLERRVQPLKLCYKSNSWYVYAFCLLRGGFRFFKLSRIIELEVTDEAFERRNVGRVLGKSLGSLAAAPAESSVRVRMKIRKDAVPRAADELPIAETLADGSAVAEFDADERWGLVDYVLSYGACAEVLAPPELRRKVAAAIQEMRGIYSPQL